MSAFDWLLACYPLGFRDRHGEGLRECWEEQVQEQGLAWATWDLFRGAFVAQWQAAHEPVELILAQGGALSVQQKARVGGPEFLQQALVTLSISLLVSFLGFRFFAPALFEGDVWVGLAAVGSLLTWQALRPLVASAQRCPDAVLACQRQAALVGTGMGCGLGTWLTYMLLPMSADASSIGASSLVLGTDFTPALAFWIVSTLWLSMVGSSFSMGSIHIPTSSRFWSKVEINVPFLVQIFALVGLALLCCRSEERWMFFCLIGFTIVSGLIHFLGPRLFRQDHGDRVRTKTFLSIYPSILPFIVLLGLVGGLISRLSDPALVGVQQRIEMSLEDLEHSQDQDQFWKGLQHEQQAWIHGAGLTTWAWAAQSPGPHVSATQWCWAVRSQVAPGVNCLLLPRDLPLVWTPADAQAVEKEMKKLRRF